MFEWGIEEANVLRAKFRGVQPRSCFWQTESPRNKIGASRTYLSSENSAHYRNQARRSAVSFNKQGTRHPVTTVYASFVNIWEQDRGLEDLSEISSYLGTRLNSASSYVSNVTN